MILAAYRFESTNLLAIMGAVISQLVELLAQRIVRNTPMGCVQRDDDTLRKF
jgi:hypothetical protein